jgi:hypothetical protein
MSLVYGKIVDMAFVANNKREWADFLVNNEGKSVIVKRETGRRSTSQNEWYWGVVLKLISNHTGHTEDELHRLFKGLFLPKKVLKFKDKDYMMASSTTELNKNQFGEYIERIRAEVASMGITIPDPVKNTAPIKNYPNEELKPTF